MKSILPILIAAALAGCQEAPAPHDANGPAAPSVSRSVEQTVAVSPASTEYTGEGKRISRKVESIRILSPFGISPGEVVSRQQPMSVQEGPRPGVNVTPVGASATEEPSGGSWSSGGFKWSWWDSIWSAIKRFLLWTVLLVGLPLLVMTLIPFTRPIASAVWRVIASVVPFLGSLVERTVAHFRLAKPLAQVVDGGQAFKNRIRAAAYLDDGQKAQVVQDFLDAQKGAQDASTQAAVDRIKA